MTINNKVHNITKGVRIGSEDSTEISDILNGSVDPSVSPGRAAPIGSLYKRLDPANPSLYQKIGPTDTDWAIFGSTAPVETDLAVLNLGRSSNLNLTTAYQNLTLDVVDVSTNTAILERNPADLHEILVKEDGLYFITYSLTIDATSGEQTYNFRMLENGTPIPQSISEISEDDEKNYVGNIFYVQLTAGDVLTISGKSSALGSVLLSTMNLTICKAIGTTGAQGAPGSGSTVNIKENGSLVQNTPHSTLNFGNGIVATDSGNGEVLVEAPQPVFGTEFNYTENQSIMTTTSAIWTIHSSMTVNVPAGKYRIMLNYGWNYNSTTSDFMGRLVIDGAQSGQYHRQEPKDSAGGFSTTSTNQRHNSTILRYVDLNAGTHTISFSFRSSNSGIKSSAWDSTIEFWRVQ
jgi:hypothetical protein